MSKALRHPASSPLYLALAGALVATIVLLTVYSVLRPERAGRAPTRPQFLGRVDPRSVVSFTLVLHIDEKALERSLRELHDPRSPSYRRFIGPRTFGARYGPSLQSIARVRTGLRAAGLRVARPSPLRTSLHVRATAAQIGAVFHVRLGRFVDASGRRYHAPLGHATVPPALGSTVVGVAGLSTRPLARPRAVPEGGLRPDDVAAAYNIKPLHDRGILGQHQTVAIVSFDSFNKEDVDRFDSEMGIKDSPPVEQIDVNGGTTVGEGAIEVNLDIDTIRGIAPKAQILNYEAPNTTGSFGDIFEAISRDRRADIVSLSWGFCDVPEDVEAADRARMVTALQAAEREGISYFEASGDWGAYTCQASDPGDLRPTVDFPSATPSVVSVGGTLLSVRDDGSYLEELGWEDLLSGFGTGGGLSLFEDRPPWQTGPGVKNRFSNGKRQIPDVAGPADFESGIVFVLDGEVRPGNGTSQAAPFWAGSMALIRQFAQRQGIRRLGYVNPVLYRLARTKQRFPPFHDVTAGGNRLHNATAGWDYATGLGSPDVFNLARALVAELKRR